jgi:hypothetical protein
LSKFFLQYAAQEYSANRLKFEKSVVDTADEILALGASQERSIHIQRSLIVGTAYAYSKRRRATQMQRLRTPDMIAVGEYHKRLDTCIN